MDTLKKVIQHFKNLLFMHLPAKAGAW